jgi:hypothetical protein
MFILRGVSARLKKCIHYRHTCDMIGSLGISVSDWFCSFIPSQSLTHQTPAPP